MNDKKSITDYYYSDERGDAHAVVYRLFPGIEVAYISLYLWDDSFCHPFRQKRSLRLCWKKGMRI